jgi:hypothetical protein
MHGIVTLRYNDTLTTAAQAIFRLRNINIEHSIDFFYPGKIIGQIFTEKIKIIENDDMEKLYDYLVESENMYKESTLKTLLMQIVNFVHRSHNMNIIKYKEPTYYDLIKYTKVDRIEEEKTRLAAAEREVLQTAAIINVIATARRRGAVITAAEIAAAAPPPAAVDTIYLSKQDFFDTVLEKINNDLYAEYGITLKSFAFNTTTEIKLEVSQEMSIKKSIEQSNETNDPSEYITMRIKDKRAPININMFKKNNSVEYNTDLYKIKYKNKTLNSFKLIGFDYTLDISFILIEKYIVNTLLYPTIIYIIDEKTIRICSIFEYCLITHNPGKFDFITEKSVYFDIYGNNIEKKEQDFLTSPNFKLVSEFLFNSNNNFVELYNNLHDIYKASPDNFILIDFLNKFCNLKKKYKLFDIHFTEISYNEHTFWSKLFNIVNPDVAKLLQKSYITKYKPAEIEIVGGYRKKYLKYKKKYINYK